MLSEYEQQREARIAHNRQRLRDLGIDDEVEALRVHHAAKQPRPTPRREVPAADIAEVRRSRRLQHKADDIVVVDEECEDGKENVVQAPQRRAPRPVTGSGSDGAEYDEHSHMRCAC